MTNDYNLAGTTGQGLRLEALKINLTTPIAGMRIKYQAHVENIGWQDWGYDGSTAGTVGQNRRIEAIRISIEKPRYTYQYDAAGNIANENDLVNNVTNSYVYDNSDRLVKTSDSNGNELGYNHDLNNNINSVTDKVNNTTHTTSYTFDKDNKLTSSSYGSSEVDNNYDSLGRMTNSATKIGTTQYNTNYSYLPGATTSNTGVTYDAHVANIGWQPTWASDGGTAGTTGQDLMMEALKVQLTNPIAEMKIKYQAQVSNIGWQDWSYDGNITGTTGQNLQMEAVKIQLEGAPTGYHVYYQAHVANLGWMDVVQDGAIAGTVGKDLKLEALRIYIVKPGVDSKDSTKVASISNNGNPISYTYDANENIKTTTQNGKIITYTYNELNEVTREDNQTLNKTIIYSYDAGGNITNKVEYSYSTGTITGATNTINYGYGDSNWKDKLTSYNGKAITFDSIGNPLSDGTFNYTWEEGRQLSAISGNGQTISYKYSDSGIRRKKP